MILRVVCQRACPASVSPYQLLDAQDQSIDWANQFLDAQRLRQLSLRSLRAYAYDLRLKQPRLIIAPLSADEAATFWRSLRTFRDLAVAGLMLLDGLRSCEVLAVQLEDLQLASTQMRVLGKGNKQRLLPLPQPIIDVLQNYLRLERPHTHSLSLFVCLKGRHRGQPMTAAGLRSLFRHHRVTSQVPQANPHRFRHTFGADMVRAGISLPALQHLMGHSQIRTTMLYVQLAPKDVWDEYARAIENRTYSSQTSLGASWT